MKKSIILLALLLMASFVVAEEVQEDVIDGPLEIALADFSIEPVQAVRINKGDLLTFEMFDGKHMLLVTELINDNIKIIFYPFKEEGKSSQGSGSLPIQMGKMIGIDIDRDKTMDVAVHLQEIDGDSAVLLIRDVKAEDPNYNVEEPTTNVPTGMPVGKIGEEENKKSWTPYLLIGVVVLGLFMFLVVRKKK